MSNQKIDEKDLAKITGGAVDISTRRDPVVKVDGTGGAGGGSTPGGPNAGQVESETEHSGPSGVSQA